MRPIVAIHRLALTKMICMRITIAVALVLYSSNLFSCCLYIRFKESLIRYSVAAVTNAMTSTITSPSHGRSPEQGKHRVAATGK